MKYLKKFNESGEYKITKSSGLYKVIHEHFATDRYQLGSTIVKAKSKEEAMEKLNVYLSTKPDGVYTSNPCKSINDVYELFVLE